MSGISLDSVTKVYPNGVTAVDALSLDIAEGEFCVLVGPSGCGKSTLLRMIAGLEDVTLGDVWIGGVDVTELSPQERNIAMVFQNYALYPHMTVSRTSPSGSRSRSCRRRSGTGASTRSQGFSGSKNCSTASRRRSREASASALRWGGRSYASRRRS